MQHAGITNGSFSVTKNGQSSYTLPIRIPPGTGGMQPSLSLAYSGNQINGLLGPGFILDGLPYIERTGQTMAQDNNWTAINYSSDDRFSLTGQRLVAIAGEYGASGTEYRTERETWSKIISSGDAGGGPATFEVINSNGHKMTFGGNLSSAVPVPNGDVIRIWSLSKVTDLNGNYYEVEYELDAANGTNRPVAIYYTGNDETTPVLLITRKITFSYESRPDRTGGYSGGYAYWQQYRLNLISVYADNELVRTYSLGYKESSVSARSELETITEADGAGIPLPCITLKRPDEPAAWINEGIEFSPVTGVPVTDRYMTLSGDLTGNGRTDLIRVWANGQMQLSYAVFPAAEDGTYESPISGTTTCPFDGFSRGLACLDIQGLGKSDLIYIYPQQGALAYVTFFWENNTFTVSAPVTLNLGLQAGLVPSIIPVDINGDGKTDILLPVQSHTATLSYFLLLSDGVQYTVQPRVDTTMPMYEAWPSMLMAANISGSPMQDLIYGVNGDSFEIYSLVSNGTGFNISAPLQLPAGGHEFVQIVPVDTTGDGLTDLALIFQEGQRAKLSILMSDGTKIIQPPLQPLPLDLGPFIASAISPVNLSGTRHTDLLIFSLDVSGNILLTPLIASNGSFVPQPAIATNQQVPVWSVLTTDIRGHGKSDVLLTVSNETLQMICFRPAAVNLGLVEHISNGVGGSIDIEYLPVGDKRVYNSGDTQTHDHAMLSQTSAASIAPVQFGGSIPSVMGASWLRNLIEVPMSLVWKVKRYNGLGQVYESELFYQKGLVSIDGRGWLGFESTSFTDLDESSTLITTYHQTFPLLGMPSSKTTSKKGSALALRVINNTFEYSTPNYPGVFQVLFTAKTKTFYPELFGSPLSHSVVKTFDDYGNCLTSFYSCPQAGTAADLYTVQTFENDTTLWCLGKLKTRVISADKAGKQVLRSRRMSYHNSNKKLKTTTEWNANDPQDSPCTTRYYDPFGNLTSIESTNGALMKFVYGHETAYTYKNKQIRKVSATLELTDHYVYNTAFGVLTSYKDVNGNEHTWELDALGRVHKVFGPGPSGKVQLRKIERNLDTKAGYVRVTTDNQNWAGTSQAVKQEIFDGLGRRYMLVQKGEGPFPVPSRTIQKILNSRGKDTQCSLPYQAGDTILWTKTTYDALGRIAEKIHPVNATENRVTKIWHEGMDKIIVHAQGSTDSISTIRQRHFYNGRTRTVKRADGLGRISNFSYDGLGRLQAATPPSGTVQTVQYDPVGLANFIEGKDFGAVTNHYKFSDRQKTVTFANGKTVKVQTDLLQRPTSITLSDGLRYDIHYDKSGPGNRIGRLSSVTLLINGTQRYKWLQEYDASGRRTQLKLETGNLSLEQSRSYYPTGQLQEIIYQDSSSAQYTYDGLGQMQSLQFKPAAGKLLPIATYSNYNAFGKPQQCTAGNGLAKIWHYSQRGNLKDLTIKHVGTLLSKSFHYDIFGRLLKVTDTATGALLNKYSYDDAGQLNTWTDSAGVVSTFAFDDSGNLQLAGKQQLSYNGANITVTPASGNPYTLNYGVTGNREKRIEGNNTTQYTYDARNLLITAPEVNFLYDHLGRRIIKSNNAGGQTVYLTNDDITQNSGAESYTVKLLRDPFGVRVAVIIPSGNGQPQMFFLDQDQTGNTILITAQNGTLLAAPGYQPFGAATDPASAVNAFLPGFAGQPFDVETGLAYFNARYFDPAIGRFVTADTRLGGTLISNNALNRFTYALNDPINLADPGGHNALAWLSGILDVIEIVAGAILAAYGFEQPGLALIGAGVAGVAYGVATLASGSSFDWGTWATYESLGFLAGGSMGSSLAADPAIAAAAAGEEAGDTGGEAMELGLDAAPEEADDVPMDDMGDAGAPDANAEEPVQQQAPRMARMPPEMEEMTGNFMDYDTLMGMDNADSEDELLENLGRGFRNGRVLEFGEQVEEWQNELQQVQRTIDRFNAPPGNDNNA